MAENSEIPHEVKVKNTGDLSGEGGITTEDGHKVTRITHGDFKTGVFSGDVEIRGGAQDGAKVPDVKITPPPTPPKSRP